jgi:hypothetical protein
MAGAYSKSRGQRQTNLWIAILLPTWLSGLIAITVGVVVTSLAVLLTREGNTVQQSLLGLQHVYVQSSVGSSVQTVGDNFAKNKYLNNVLLFLLWGSAGLVIYSILQSILREFSRANELLRRLDYVNADRHGIIRSVATRTAIRLAAFVCWWLLVRLTIFRVIPYTIAAAHTSALSLADASAWLHTVEAAVGCMLCVHALTVLLRLSLLRVRLLGSDIIS